MDNFKVETDFSTKDIEPFINLRKNAYQFSSAKSYEELKLISSQLIDTKGNILPFNKFKEKAGKITEIQNHQYLRTEYNHAVNASLSASKYQTAYRHRKVLPYLKYETAGDERVRTSHKALNGVVRKVTDPFWDQYMPPNGWGCRCTIISLASAEPTDMRKVSVPDVPRMFLYNPGKREMLFPKDHPYFKHAPVKTVKAIQQSLFDEKRYRKNYKEWIAIDKNKQFVPIEKLSGFNYRSGGFIALEKGHDLQKIEIQTANAIRNFGYSIIFRKKLTPYEKHIDAIVNGKLTEIKSISNASNVFNALKFQLRRINKQLNNSNIKAEAIIHLTKKNDLNDIKRAFNSALNQGYLDRVNKVTFIFGENKMIIINKKDFAKSKSILK